jgi:uncharacterized membrane-anchored protein YhcB (DUF1043 family)
MVWLIGLLTPRFGPKVAALISYALVIGVICGLVWWALDSYGDRKFNEGVEANQAQVEKALEQLKTDAAESATKADDKAAERAAEHVEQQAADQEAIDEANRNGTSPLDALFGA